MNNRKQLISVFLLFTIFFAACNLLKTQAASPTSVPGETATALGQTESAESTLLATLQVTRIPSQTDTITPTASQTASQTPTSTNTPTRVPTDTQVPTAIPCYKAVFIRDITIPDGTILNPGANFTKIWRLLNAGSCTWTTSFKLIFDHGVAMSGPAATNLPETVIPGQTVDLAVALTAPATQGTYQGFWKLQADTGATFGIPPDNNTPFWVVITVNATPVPFSVDNVLTSVDTAAITTACPTGHEFTFTANITTNEAGTVNYHWEFSDGSKTSTRILDFNSAGTQTVSATWDLGSTDLVSPNPFDGWARIFVDAPNNQAFSMVNFTLTCTK
ncbi:MAG: NBR1-Ig-like domain-containing protein [Anaerolineaceae bacterium]|nr:NBR1-Ig-like domain-containing protein [Anaerolineaceae bacterium]